MADALDVDGVGHICGVFEGDGLVIGYGLKGEWLIERVDKSCVSIKEKGS